MKKTKDRDYMKLAAVDGASVATVTPEPGAVVVAAPMITPPDSYKPDQLAVWNEFVARAGGSLTEADRFSLEILVEAIILHRKASAKVREFGSVIMSPSKYPIQSPYVSDMNKQAAIIARGMTALGLTPESRQRGTKGKKPARRGSAFADCKQLTVD